VEAGRKLGEAYIAVTADARNVGRDLSEEAEKALADAARAMGETLDDELADAAARGLDGLGPAVEDSVTRSTERAGGKMAAALNKRLVAALGNLPEVTVQADATEADYALASIRERLNSLSSARIGVDVSTTAALSELDIMQAELAQLAASDVDVAIRVDAASAAAELAAVTSLVSDIDGSTADVNVRADTSSIDRIPGSASGAGGSLGVLAAAAIAVSPALLAIGAAAVAGIGMVGPLAVGAAAGLGAMLLGFAGVGNAVKLLDQRQAALATQTGKSAGSQVSNAGAVEQATRSLANTQANAADAAIKAAERVADAEEALTEARLAAADKETRAREAAAASIQTALRRQSSAQDSLTDSLLDVARAQESVNDAILAAQRRFEDLSNSVASNALAQRRSVASVADAYEALQKVQRNRHATDEMRDAAQLAYEEQLQQQRELKLTGDRLAAQQAEANATGVDGADEVVSARQRLADAEARAADDRQAVADADAALEAARIKGANDVARAQAEGAAKIADAQDAITDALREQATQARQAKFSIEQATAALAAAGAAGAAAGAAGASGLGAIDDELAKVDPATRRFAEYFDSTMRPAFDRLKASAAAGLLPGVEAGFDAILPLMPRFERFLGSLGTTVGNVFRELGERLNSPFWSDFFTMLETTAGPAFETVAGAVLDVVEGLAGILMAFAPMQEDVNGGLLSLTDRFATWGKELKDSEGFKNFIAYVQDNWPKVQEILGNLADLVGNLLEGGAGATSPVLDALVQLSDVLASIPPDVLVGLITAFIGLQAASSAGGAVSRFSEGLKSFTGVTSGAVDKVAAFGDKLVEYGPRLGEYREKLASAVETAKGLPDKLSRVGSAISSTGSKVGTAIADGGRLIAHWGRMSAAAATEAAKTAGAWVASAARTTASLATQAAQFVVQGARMVVQAAITAASVVASWVVMGAQATLQAARMAAAWLIAMGPIAIAVAAIVGIVILVVKYWDEIKQFTIDAWTAASEAVGRGIDWIVDFVTGLPGRAWSALSGLGSMLADLFSSAWRWARDTVGRGIDGLIDFVTRLPGRAMDGLRNLGSMLGDVFGTAWRWARDAVSGGIDNVLGFVTGLPGRITGALSGLGSLLIGLGGDLMRGLVNGIESAAGFVGNVGRNIVNSVIGFVNSQVIDRVNNLLTFEVAGIKVNPPDIPRIPRLANGAIVTRATLAIIGEAGPEAVVPLSSGRARRRDQLMKRTGLGGEGYIDARQYYTVRDTQTAEEVGAVVGTRVVRDVRNGVSSRYSGAAA